MANEASVRVELQITKDNLQYRSHPTSYRADVEGALGPTPGAFTASLIGTDVDLSELEIPGFCVIKNLDSTNFIEVGVFDGTEFYPLLELLPGEIQVVRLSRYLGISIGTGDTGTGSYDAGAYSMRVKATVAPCVVSVEAFEA